MRTLFQKALAISSLFIVNISAQITINSTDMPAVDTIYHFHTASVSGVDHDITGAGIIWDYTNLANTGFSQDSFANPVVTPFVYQLIFNNFLYPSYDATHAQPGSDIVLPAQIPFTVTNVYNFYKNSSSSFKMLGFGATINGLPAPIQYQGSDRIYKFPLTYGNIDTSTYYFEVPVPTLGYWNQSGKRYNHVDGYGTLLLPNGVSYEVVRLKSTIEIVDSVHIDAIGFTIPVPRIQTDYKFMATGEGEPVLQITTQPLLLVFGPETVTGVKYKNEMNLASVNNENETCFNVYPNPATDNLTILNAQLKHWSKLQLFNTSGQAAFTDITGGSGNISLDISSLAPGTYHLLLELENGKTYTQKISIR